MSHARPCVDDLATFPAAGPSTAQPPERYRGCVTAWAPSRSPAGLKMGCPPPHSLRSEATSLRSSRPTSPPSPTRRCRWEPGPCSPLGELAAIAMVGSQTPLRVVSVPTVPRAFGPDGEARPLPR